LFHIVLLHRSAPQVGRNQWIDDSRPRRITTTPEIAARCTEIAERSEALRVHRIDWGGQPAVVCCECEVEAVGPLDEHQYQVNLANHRVLEILPLVRPVRGQSSYEI
jgi:hypothetical protein